MRLLLLIPIVIIVFFDYISKIYVKRILSENSYYILNDYIYLEKFYNKGIAFSLFDSDSIVLNYILLIIITIIILYLIYIFLRDLYSSSKVLLFSYVLIIGGALGNYLDRIMNGTVFDFIILHYNDFYFPAVFNIADASITIGAVIFITSYLINGNLND